jgi:hypothetical protein
VGSIASLLEKPFGTRASGRENHVFADADRVTGKLERVLFGYGESLVWANAVGDGRLSISIKGAGEEEEFTTTQGTEAGIEMIKPAVHELERNDLSTEPLAEDREGSDVRPLTVPTEPPIGKAE